MKLGLNLYAMAVAISGLIVLSLILTSTNETKNLEQSQVVTLEQRFNMLKDAQTNYCAGPQMVEIRQNDERLQGSCCSPMAFHRYEEQVESLKKYSHIKQIPKDPYDIEVSLAKELLGYQKTIKLTDDQQKIYDDAMKMSHEGGPCCCKCWRWDAFEGLAKYLITEHNFDSQQVAEVWDLIDGCGGEGHAHVEVTPK
jgi:hypothetical protein